MSTLHFTITLIIGVYAYVLLPDWVGMMFAVSLYTMWAEGFDPKSLEDLL
jgi:hypothetical protein